MAAVSGLIREGLVEKKLLGRDGAAGRQTHFRQRALLAKDQTLISRSFSMRVRERGRMRGKGRSGPWLAM